MPKDKNVPKCSVRIGDAAGDIDTCDKDAAFITRDGIAFCIDHANYEKTFSIPVFDPVEKPKHYNVHPSGVECIQITEHMNFCIGNAIKYLWRADDKDNDIEDLKKARWYVDREIQRRESKK